MQKIFYFFIVVWLLIFSKLYAQTDTTVKAQDDLLNSLTTDTAQKQQLLPDRMIFTQRFLWGKKGLMRTIGKMPLNEANRTKELKIRRSMLVAHQSLGYVTAAGMVATGILGAKMYTTLGPNAYVKGGPGSNLKKWHGGVGTGVIVTYFSGAFLSLFSPPLLINRKTKKLNSTKLHKYLAMIHFPAMVTVSVLADAAKNNTTIRMYHRDAAYTAFTAFGLAMIVMAFK